MLEEHDEPIPEDKAETSNRSNPPFFLRILDKSTGIDILTLPSKDRVHSRDVEAIAEGKEGTHVNSESLHRANDTRSRDNFHCDTLIPP